MENFFQQNLNINTNEQNKQEIIEKFNINSNQQQIFTLKYVII